MKNYLKGAFKAFFDYSSMTLVFGLFLFSFLDYLWFYSFLLFTLLALVLFTEYSALAQKEKKAHSNVSHYPYKGFILGLLGFLPYIIIELIYPFIVLDSELAIRIKELVLNSALGLLYWFYKLGNESTLAYALASLIVPVVAGLGYLAGYYGFEFSAFYRKYFNKNASGQNNKKN